MFEGILLIDKSDGMTSFDVIRRLKRLFSTKQKIGHAGTLDPFATGLLIITLGKCTKLFDSFQLMPKEYRVTSEFGFETDTYDITGEETFKCKKEILEKNLLKSMEKFKGEIMQVPPNFSAKKIGGKRAYELARKKEDFKLEPKQVNIYSLELLNFEFPKFEIRVKCSKGTYIRSLVVDIARDLGTYATPVSLRRESIGKYSVEDAKTVGNINSETELRSFLLLP
jgi:tRNA pseudouridine55 synthase